ncbi:P-loop containing nucleoside triphosphate hydrolase protein [Lipomyces oligophaga]|uniref:P-loop containing nucleoside triphosphate hydrolase protein n=1 Tax=Lipomyces oligophaga TaxID=45792 RepID=UPI0034CE16C9
MDERVPVTSRALREDKPARTAGTSLPQRKLQSTNVYSPQSLPNRSLLPLTVLSGIIKISEGNEDDSFSIKEYAGNDEWTPDIYANKFTPSWQKSVNSYPALSTSSVAPPCVDWKMYVQEFAGNRIIQYEPPSTFEQALSVANSLKSKELSISTYQHYFNYLLSADLTAQRAEVARYALYSVPLQISDPSTFMFALSCPGIREFTPDVAIGDLLLFRQLRPQFAAHGPASFTGYIHEGIIWQINRNDGLVYVRIDGLILESNLFNVEFTTDHQIFSVRIDTVRNFALELVDRMDNFSREMLFPNDLDGVMQTTLSKGTFDFDWVDDGQNFEQQKAIDAIVSQNYGHVPYLISGPPGTGKTRTIVEATIQLIKSNPDCHILLCAPSDSAADTLALRLRHNMSNQDLFRLNNDRRSFAEVPMELLHYCETSSVMAIDLFVLPEFAKLMKFRVVVSTCRDAKLLLEAQCTNRSLSRLDDYMRKAFGYSSPKRLHWNALLIDEAGQGTEPDCLIPLRVVLPPDSNDVDPPLFVMAGDHNQLGPRTALRQAGCSDLEISLFERLMNLPFYSCHPLARKHLSHSNTVKLPYIRPGFTTLIRNYRSHAGLLAVPSSLFYFDTLLPEATNVDSLTTWTRLPNSEIPMLFIENRDLDEMVEDGISWYNTTEIDHCQAVVRSLIEQCSVRPADIAIAIPFREQIRRVRNRLRKIGLRDVNVGPVESYQGAEFRVVIVCTTRTRDRFLAQDYQRGMGIIHEAKRFNVAITRSKELLVVIGNISVLQRDINWRTLLSFCSRNHLFDREQGSSWVPAQSELDTPLYYSKIEHSINSRARFRYGKSFNDQVVDDPMWIAGMQAETDLIDSL